jgi:hypothetical protein
VCALSAVAPGSSSTAAGTSTIATATSVNMADSTGNHSRLRSRRMMASDWESRRKER